jgi:hypothetical protein
LAIGIRVPQACRFRSGAWLKNHTASQILGLVAGPEYQPPSNRGPPILHTTLKSPQLAGAEWCWRLGLKSLEERLGNRIGLLVEPLLDEGPNVLEWIDPSSPRPWSCRLLAVGADSEGWRSAFRTDVDHDSEVMPISVPN